MRKKLSLSGRKSKAALLLAGLVLCMGLGGCGGDATNGGNGTDKALTHEYLGFSGVDSAILTDGVTVNIDADAVRERYFDLAADMRWDMLPQFDFDAPPQDVVDYIYLILADNIVWSDQYNIDHEKTPELISAGAVHDYILTHFGEDVEQPEAGNIARVDFDGENYMYPATSWANPPLYYLDSLTVNGVSDSEGESIVYTAVLTKYQELGSSQRSDLRESVINGQAEWAGLAAGEELTVRFGLSDDGEIVYRAVDVEY